MKNKNMFPWVFWQSFNSLKKPAIITLAVYVFLFSMLVLLGGLETATSVFLLYCYVLPVTSVIFAFKSYGFVFKRSASDFYHSLPITRKQTFFANSLAWFSWLTLLFIAPLTNSLIHDLVFDVYSSYPFSDALNTFLTCFYFYSISVFAINITGTLFTAIINICIIFILPALTQLIYVYNLTLTVDSLVYDSYNVILDNVDFFYLSDSPFYVVSSFILFLLGFFAVKNRKSESAKKVAPNKFLQAVYAILLGFFFSIVAFYVVFEDSAWAITVYGISLVCCFFYEFIATKGIAGLKRGLITTSALILLNVLLVGSFFATASFCKNHKFTVTGFQMIDFAKQSGYQTPNGRYITCWGSLENYSTKSYANILLEDYYVNDPDLCIKMAEHIYNTSSGNPAKKQPTNGVLVTFKDRYGIIHYRNVSLPTSAYNQIADYIRSNPYWISCLITLPEAKNVHTLSAKIENGLNLSTTFDESVYKTFTEEFSALDETQKLSILANVPNNFCYPTVVSLKEKNVGRIIFSIDGVYNSKSFSSKYFIDPELTPKTYKVVFSALEEKNKNNFEEFKRIFVDETLNAQKESATMELLYKKSFLTNVSTNSPQYSIDATVYVRKYTETIYSNVLGIEQRHKTFFTDFANRLQPSINGLTCKVYVYAQGSYDFTAYLSPEDYTWLLAQLKGDDAN